MDKEKTFRDATDFRLSATYVINKAIRLLKRNKGIEITLSPQGKSMRIKTFANSVQETYICYFYLYWPKAEIIEHSITSEYWDGRIDPANMPLIDDITKEQLKSIKATYSNLSDDDYVALCIATWLYNLGKEWDYF